MTPEPQIAAQPEPKLPEPSLPDPGSAAAPPPPGTLAGELTQTPAATEPSEEPAAAAPAPPPEPVVQLAEPPPEPLPAAPATIEADAEPPPPPAESLTSGPAVEPQTAALPPAPVLAEQIRVMFREGSVELDDDAQRRLSAVATALTENPIVRIQLLAYAKTSSDGSSRARRLSLSRALAVRAYLIEKGVRSTRMDVRALGDKLGDGPADRVDIRPQAAN
jgi:outer membrane protein OmpA-like peptidoglycan-associated protein